MPDNATAAKSPVTEDSRLASKPYWALGVARDTGSEVVIRVDATSKANARAKAELRGMVVTSVSRAPKQRISATGEAARHIGTSVRRVRYQSLGTLGFGVSPLALLFAGCITVVNSFLAGALDDMSSPGYILGSLFGNFAIYFAFGLFVALRVWKWTGRSQRAANGAFCATIIVFFGLTQFGQMPARAHAASEAGEVAIQYALEPSSAMVQAQKRFSELEQGTSTNSNCVSVIIWAFSDGVPWSVLDRTAAKMTRTGKKAYAEWKHAAVECGYNPIWTEREHLLYERYHAFQSRLIDFFLANGRSPKIHELYQVPVNPFTESNHVAPLGYSRSSDGWAYEVVGTKYFRLKAVVPIGYRCRSLAGKQEQP